MAWVRPKHPKRKVEVDPVDALRPVLEYFSCTRPTGSNSNNKQVLRIPKKPLLLLDSSDSRPSKRQHEELEYHHTPENHRQRSQYHPQSEHRQSSQYHPQSEHRPQTERHLRAEPHTVYYDRLDSRGERSQRSTSHYTRDTRYTRDISPPPPPPPLTSYNLKARPGAHLRLTPSRHRTAADTYSSRRPASSWASATTPLDM